MKIIALLVDGHAHVRLVATRAPDLFRRQVSAETGHATLVAVSLAPPGLSPEALITQVDQRFAACRLAPGVYSVAPGTLVRAVARARLAFQIRAALAMVSGQVRRGGRRLRWTLRLMTTS